MQTLTDDFLGHELEEWEPMPPNMGPPLPRFLDIYWPWYTPPGAEFKLSNLIISPSIVQVGYPITISCTTENIGSEAGEKTIECKVEGVTMAEQTITLNPGESTTVSFGVVPTVAKTYSVSVDGLTGSFRATIEVPPEVADIRAENLEITPAEVNVGEVVTISVRATNYGTASGSKVITCNVV